MSSQSAQRLVKTVCRAPHATPRLAAAPLKPGCALSDTPPSESLWPTAPQCPPTPTPTLTQRPPLPPSHLRTNLRRCWS